MEIFNKILKPPLTTLRKQGIFPVIFVNYSHLHERFRSECLENVDETASLLTSLEFTIHKEKPLSEPTQCTEFLRFVINSADITVKVNPIKNKKTMEKKELKTYK